MKPVEDAYHNAKGELVKWKFGHPNRHRPRKPATCRKRKHAMAKHLG